MAGISETAALTIQLSSEMSQSVRDFVAETSDGSPEAITRFVEETVSRQPFLAKTEKIRQRFAHLNENQIDSLVEEAPAWARSPDGRDCG
jgi:hypothetical protein